MDEKQEQRCLRGELGCQFCVEEVLCQEGREYTASVWATGYERIILTSVCKCCLLAKVGLNPQRGERSQFGVEQE